MSRKSKAAAQRRHARRRMRERHGLSLTRNEHADLVCQIQQGKGVFVERQSHRITVWDLQYKERRLRVVYDARRKNIVTILPDTEARTFMAEMLGREEKSMTTIGLHYDVQAFDDKAIGTRIKDGCRDQFLKLVEDGFAAFDCASHDADPDKQTGQYFIMLPKSVTEIVTCGEGRRTLNPDDYVNREWRGEVDQFLKREHAARVTGCAIVLYTWDAYMADNQVDKTKLNLVRAVGANHVPEEGKDFSHVITAVLAFGGPEGSRPSPRRFAANLAGGNKEYDILARANDHMKKHLSDGIDEAAYETERLAFVSKEVDRLVLLATDVVNHNAEWCTVAD